MSESTTSVDKTSTSPHDVNSSKVDINTNEEKLEPEILKVLNCVYCSIRHAPAPAIRNYDKRTLLSDSDSVTLLFNGFARRVYFKSDAYGDNYKTYNSPVPNVIEELICSFIVISNILDDIDCQIMSFLTAQRNNYHYDYDHDGNYSKFKNQLCKILNKSIIKWYFTNNIYKSILNMIKRPDKNYNYDYNSRQIMSLGIDYNHEINATIFDNIIKPQLEAIEAKEKVIESQQASCNFEFDQNSADINIISKVVVVCANKYQYMAFIQYCESGVDANTNAKESYIMVNISHWYNLCDILSKPSSPVPETKKNEIVAMTRLRNVSPAYISITSRFGDEPECINFTQLGVFILARITNKRVNTMWQYFTNGNNVMIEKDDVLGMMIMIVELFYPFQLRVSGVATYRNLPKTRITKWLQNVVSWIVDKKMVGEYESVSKDEFLNSFGNWLIEYNSQS